MNCDPDLHAVDTMPSVESLLFAAADYEPNSSMPIRVEEQACRRIVRLRRTQRRGRVLMIACGMMLAAILGPVALMRGRRYNPGAGRDPEVHSSRRPSVPTGQERTASVQRVPLPSAEAIRKDYRLARREGADPRIVNDHGNRVPKSATHVVRRRILSFRLGQRHDRPVARTVARVVHRVWRTEVLETETAGYFAPALLAKPDEEHGTLTFTAAAVAIPVRATQSIFRSSEDSGHRGISAQSDSGPLPQNEENSGENR